MTGGSPAELAGMLEKGRVIEDPDLLLSYATAMRGASGRAGFVVEPGDVPEVSIIAAWAHRHRRRLLVQGANTGLVGASTPDGSGEQGVVSLRRLDRIEALAPEAKTVDVEAGVTLRDLNEHLAPHGLFFPVEVGSNPTVGGCSPPTPAAPTPSGTATPETGWWGSRVWSPTPRARSSGVCGGPRRTTPGWTPPGCWSVPMGVSVSSSAPGCRWPSCQARATAMLAPSGYEAVSGCLRRLRSALGEALLAFELISGEAMRMTVANVSAVPRPFGSEEHVYYVLVEVGSSGTSTELEERLARVLAELIAVSPDALLDAVVAHRRTSGVCGTPSVMGCAARAPRSDSTWA